MKKILIIATILTANIFAFDSVTYFGGVNAEGELTIKSPTGEQKQQQGYKLVAGMELNNELRNHKNIELDDGTLYMCCSYKGNMKMMSKEKIKMCTDMTIRK